MQDQEPIPFYIKVQYKHIIKKLKVTDLSKLTIEFIFNQFSQYVVGNVKFLHYQSLDAPLTYLFSDKKLQQILAQKKESKQSIKLYITKSNTTSILDESVNSKKQIKSKSQCYSLQRFTSSWKLFQSMVQNDNMKLRKLSDEIKDSQQQLRKLKNEKRQTSLSMLLQFN